MITLYRKRLFFSRLVAAVMILLLAVPVGTSLVSPAPAEAADWAGWNGISTIYYNPAQEDARNPFLQTAASELETYLEQMSGRPWTVVTGSSPAAPAIYLTVNGADPQLAGRGVEAFRLVLDSNGVTIIGKTALAVRWGAYYLLDEKLGVRWFFKNPAWTVVPGSLDFLGTTNEVHEPDYFFRELACLNSTLFNQADLSNWNKHNRMIGAKFYPTWHTSDEVIMYRFGTLDQAEFNAYPNAFIPLGLPWASHPANPGVNGDWQLNPNDPNVVQWFLAYVDSLLGVVRSDLAWEPDILTYGSIWATPRDGQGWAPPYVNANTGILNDTDALTNDWFAMVKKVADAIAAEHPGDYTGALDYADISGEINQVLPSNVIVEVTSGLSFSDHKNSERVIAAANSGATVGWYPYLNVWAWYHGQMFYPFMIDQVRQIKWLHDNGVTYYNAEALDSWGDRGIIYYLAGKMLWDSDADVDALIDDFFTKSFGAAAGVMKQYYETMLGPQRDVVMAQAYSLLSQAESMVSGAELTRVRHIEYYNRFLWKYSHVGLANLSTADLAAFYTFNGKVRDTGMIDYSDLELEMRSALAGRGYTTAQINALQDFTPPTAQQAQAWMAEGLAEFNVPFSKIVSARFMDLEALGDSTAAVAALKGGSRVILVQSPGNENVRINVSTTSSTGLGMMWYDPNGTAIDHWAASGTLNTSVYFPAAAAGTYLLHVTTNLPHDTLNAYVDVPDRPAAIMAARSSGNFWPEWDNLNSVNGKSTNAAEWVGANVQFFYVPSGTPSFTFGSTTGGNNVSGTLYSPSNAATNFNWTSTNYANDTSNVMVSNPQAGLWRLSLTGTPQHNILWLEGVPPLLWHDPYYLLVPATGTTSPAPPVLSAIGNRSVNLGQSLNFTVSATDPNGDPLTYSASSLPAGSSFNPSNRTFSWTPAAGQVGNYANVHFEVSDGALTDFENITITVTDINGPPVLAAIGNKAAYEGQLLSFAISATDPNGGTLTYSASSLPAGSSFNPSTRTFSWTPAAVQTGTYANVHFEVSDGALADFENITITVSSPMYVLYRVNAGGGSYIDTLGNTWLADQMYTVGGWGAYGLNETVDRGQIEIAGTSDDRIYQTERWNFDGYRFTVPNGTYDVKLHFAETYEPGVGRRVFDVSVEEQLALDDLDIFAEAGMNAALTKEIRNVVVTDNLLHIAVTQNAASDEINGIEIMSTGANQAPVLGAIGNRAVNEGQLLQFTVAATDPDGDALVYSAANLPAGAAFSAATRTFSWVPTYDQAGTYAGIQFVASDGALTDFENITITVSDAQTPGDPDVNGDGLVNILDVTLVSQRWGQTGAPGWIPEDVNRDGKIDVLDVIMVSQSWTG
jgi:hypothetical protein